MNSPVYTKKLCMSEFSIRHSRIPCLRFLDIQDNAKLTVAFIYIVSGEATLQTATEALPIKKHDLIYIPENTQYTLNWNSRDEIEYYVLFALARDYSTAMMTDSYGLQRIEHMSNSVTGETFSRICKLMSSDVRRNKVEAVGIYYCMYAEILDHLTKTVARSYHPALLMALDYISKEYAKDPSLSDIARQCNISETRLSHLFQEQLHTTPIAFKNEKKIQRATELLKSDKSIEAICELAGFPSLTYSYRVFRRFTHLTPGEYRELLK